MQSVRYLIVFLVQLLPPTSLMTELDQIDKRRIALELNVAQQQKKQNQLLQSLQKLQQEFDQSRQAQKVTFKQWRQYLRHMTLWSTPSWRWLLAAQTNQVVDVMRLQRLVWLVTRGTHLVHQQQTTHQQQLAVLKTDIQQRQRDVQTTITEHRRLLQDLQRNLSKRQRFQQGVQHQRHKAQAWARETTLAQHKLQRMVTQLPAHTKPATRSFSHDRGKLPWPAVGLRRRGFIGDGQKTAVGWSIVAPVGSPVLAIASGVVVYSGWLQGYGQTVIVDHFDGFHVVLAHLGALKVEVGDWVTSGQQVGTVGNTGALVDSALYFEIRERGIAVDPRRFLRANAF